MQHAVLSIFLIALFATADFVTGRDYFKAAGFPGRSIWYTGALVICEMFGIGWAFGHPYGWALIGFGWALWRGVLGWSSFGGSMDAKTVQETISEFLRNAISSLFPMIAAGYAVHDGGRAVVVMSLFAVWATAVAVWFGFESRRGHDVDPWVDALHGAGFGVALAVLIAS